MKLDEICRVLEGIAPLHLAQSWDNVGLLTGDPRAECTSISLAIDLTAAVVDEAIEHMATSHQGAPTPRAIIPKIVRLSPRPHQPMRRSHFRGFNRVRAAATDSCEKYPTHNPAVRADKCTAL